MPIAPLLAKLGQGGQPVTGWTSPEELERRRAIAEALMMEGIGSEPIAHPLQGAAKMAQALMGGLAIRRAGKEERAGRKDYRDTILKTLETFGGGGGGGAYPDTGPASTGSVEAPAGPAGYTGGGPTSGPLLEAADAAGAVPVSGGSMAESGPPGAMPSPDQVMAYAQQAAARRRIDPGTATKVVGSEYSPKNWQSTITSGGQREPSFGPLQMHDKYMGADFTRATGLRASDPSTWREQIDFGLDRALEQGWKPWHGAKRVGIGQWEGIPRGETAEAPGAQPVSGGTMAESGPPEASGFVLEKQAGIRKQPIAQTTRSYLERAGQATGLRAVVVSGGQDATGPHRTGSHRHDHGGAADIDLVDIATGRVLSQRNPADRARMAAFIEESVAAGATGIGAGPGYMADTRIHVGGGSEAVWGAGGSSSNAADWAKEAYYRGKTRQRRGGGGETAEVPGTVPVGFDLTAQDGGDVARERIAAALLAAGVEPPGITAPIPRPRPTPPSERIAGAYDYDAEIEVPEGSVPELDAIAARADAENIDPRAPRPRPTIPADLINNVPLPPEADPAQAEAVAAAAAAQGMDPRIPQARPELPPEVLAAALAQTQPQDPRTPQPRPDLPPPIQQAAGQQPLPAEPATTGSVPGGDDLLARARTVGFGNLDAPETPGGNPALAQALMAGGGDMGGGGMPGGQSKEAMVAALLGHPYADPRLAQFALERLYPDPGDPFTLGENQIRYDANGNVIARGSGGGEGTGADEYGLVPQWGTDAQGNPVLIQVSKSGKGKQTELPPGVKLNAGIEKIDAGTQWILLDRKSGQVVGTMPKDVAGEAAERAAGTSAGEAAGSIPKVLQQAETALRQIQDVRNDPARKAGTGLSAWRNAVWGTPQYDFGLRVAQLKGQAFLAAFESLKGGGAITNVEGEKATQAIARLDPFGTEEGFEQALKDLEEVIQAGVKRARQRARQEPVTEEVMTEQPAGIPTISSDAEYDELPSGEEFVGPDGKKRRKP